MIGFRYPYPFLRLPCARIGRLAARMQEVRTNAYLILRAGMPIHLSQCVPVSAHRSMPLAAGGGYCSAASCVPVSAFVAQAGHVDRSNADRRPGHARHGRKFRAASRAYPFLRIDRAVQDVRNDRGVPVSAAEACASRPQACAGVPISAWRKQGRVRMRRNNAYPFLRPVGPGEGRKMGRSPASRASQCRSQLRTPQAWLTAGKASGTLRGGGERRGTDEAWKRSRPRATAPENKKPRHGAGFHAVGAHKARRRSTLTAG